MNVLLHKRVFRLEAGNIADNAKRWADDRKIPIEIAVARRWFRAEITIATPLAATDARRADLLAFIDNEDFEAMAW